MPEGYSVHAEHARQVIRYWTEENDVGLAAQYMAETDHAETLPSSLHGGDPASRVMRLASMGVLTPADGSGTIEVWW